MSDLMKRLDNLRSQIQKPEFLEGKGLSNEVNIRIFCYDPKYEMAVRHFVRGLKEDQSLSCRLIEYTCIRCFSRFAMTRESPIAWHSRRRKRERSSY